jgi:hypothetical protein
VRGADAAARVLRAGPTSAHALRIGLDFVSHDFFLTQRAARLPLDRRRPPTSGCPARGCGRCRSRPRPGRAAPASRAASTARAGTGQGSSCYAPSAAIQNATERRILLWKTRRAPDRSPGGPDSHGLGAPQLALEPPAPPQLLEPADQRRACLAVPAVLQPQRRYLRGVRQVTALSGELTTCSGGGSRRNIRPLYASRPSDLPRPPVVDRQLPPANIRRRPV